MPVEGLKSLQSKLGPKETMAMLDAEIRAEGMTVFARVNHAALASEIGMELRPTEVILFGNPRGGTPLMQQGQTIGIDLPLKALIWQDAAGLTWISFNEVEWLAKRHELAGVEGVVIKLTQVLDAVVSKAANG